MTGWRKLHSEELNDSCDDQMTENEMGGACGTYGGRDLHTGF